jgi:hypothetical protein
MASKNQLTGMTGVYPFDPGDGVHVLDVTDRGAPYSCSARCQEDHEHDLVWELQHPRTTKGAGP